MPPSGFLCSIRNLLRISQTRTLRSDSPSPFSLPSMARKTTNAESSLPEGEQWKHLEELVFLSSKTAPPAISPQKAELLKSLQTIGAALVLEHGGALDQMTDAILDELVRISTEQPLPDRPIVYSKSMRLSEGFKTFAKMENHQLEEDGKIYTSVWRRNDQQLYDRILEYGCLMSYKYPMIFRDLYICQVHKLSRLFSMLDTIVDRAALGKSASDDNDQLAAIKVEYGDKFVGMLHALLKEWRQDPNCLYLFNGRSSPHSSLEKYIVSNAANPDPKHGSWYLHRAPRDSGFSWTMFRFIGTLSKDMFDPIDKTDAIDPGFQKQTWLEMGLLFASAYSSRLAVAWIPALHEYSIEDLGHETKVVSYYSWYRESCNTEPNYKVN